MNDDRPARGLAPLGRRQLLRLGIGAAAVGAGASVLGACGGSGSGGSRPAATPSGWSAKPLTEVHARQVDAAEVVPERQLAAWIADLDKRGLRATGSDAHEQYVTELAARLRLAGVQDVRFESMQFGRWTPKAASLRLLDGPRPGDVPVASYVPYSGSTPDGGVSGPLVSVDPKANLAPGSLVGKIALLPMPTTPLTLGTFKALAVRSYDPENKLTDATPYNRTWLAIGGIVEAIGKVRDAGAAGAVVALDEDAAAAAGSYFPYDGIVRSMPALYVDRAAGFTLATVADGNHRVQLTLPATTEQVPTRNVLGTIPGASEELMVLHSHTDGTNGLEDNGPDAIVAIAQYLARLPRAALPRTVLVLLTSGHFAGGVGALDFVDRHRDDLVPRIGAAICIEHLGAKEWGPQPDGSLGPTGNAEAGGIFLPPTAVLADAALGFFQQSNAAPGFAMRPLDMHPADRTKAAWPGEGQYLWAWGGIPTMNYITGPTYLLNSGVDTLARTDTARVRREVVAFTQMLLDLSRVPFAKLHAHDL